MKKTKLGRIVYWSILVALLGVFLFSAGSLIKYYAESAQSKKTYESLQALRGTVRRPAPSEPAVTEPELVTVNGVEVLAELAELYELNSDLVGWLTVPGTNVDYPVVQRTETKDYYLHRDFYGNHDSHGCLYAQENCDVRYSDNVVIYGHRMKDQTMLAQLAMYESKDFWEENQYLYFDTLTEHQTYQIIYVFTTSASPGKGFEYHRMVDAADKQEFSHFLVNCAQYSLYDTGLSAVYGDKLLTLSTCEYSQENGRLVVVAKRID